MQFAQRECEYEFECEFEYEFASLHIHIRLSSYKCRALYITLLTTGKVLIEADHSSTHSWPSRAGLMNRALRITGTLACILYSVCV